MGVFYIGIGGVARSGKDSLAKSLLEIIKSKNPNLITKITPLSGPLKADCADFIKKKLGLNVFSQDSVEKSLFREMLVWYGRVKRGLSAGTYWTCLLDSAIERDPVDICIVPDIRYQEYEKDEIFWLKSKDPNCFIHIIRQLSNGETQPPANADESNNDSKIRKFADIKLTIDSSSYFTKLSDIAENIYDQHLKIKIHNHVK